MCADSPEDRRPPRELDGAELDTGHGELSRADVEVSARSAVYAGYYRVDRYRLRHRRHAGDYSSELVREVFERGHIAAVLPVDAVRDEVVLIEQFRPGAYAAGWSPWLLECVAGIIEAGESSEQVARRESLEEAAVEVDELIPIARFLSSPGASSETVSLYCGRVDARRAGGVHGLAEEGEDIRVHVLGVERALALLREGRVVNAKTLIALQWLALNYADLKPRWSR